MEITGLQIVFILIALAEWIFMESPLALRGYLAEGWVIPVELESARYATVFGILFAYYIGGRLIYRKKPDSSQPIVLRSRGVLWAFFFYVPYLLHGLVGNMIFLFRENGREEGLVFFLVKLLAFIWLSVKLYKMPKESQTSSTLLGTDQQKMVNNRRKGERLFRICLVGAFVLMWTELVFLRFQGFFLRGIVSILRLLMLIYIIAWPVYGKYKNLE